MAARARHDRQSSGSPVGRASRALRSSSAAAPVVARTGAPVAARMVARVVASGLAVLTVAAVLAGCGGTPAVTNLRDAGIVVQADCLDAQVVRDLGLVPDDGGATTTSQAPSVAAPGGVPEDFAPVSVLVCTASATLRSTSGTWAAVTESRREGDLAPLLAALARPSQEPTGACETSASVPTVLWLVDALGRAVRPVWPTDPCGAPAPDVQAALDALDETDTIDFPVQRVDPGPPSGR